MFKRLAPSTGRAELAAQGGPPMPERPVNGAVMLVVTLLLVATSLTLAFLAGPFGRELTIGQQEMRDWIGRH